jgi:hypothetical protein
LSRVGGCRERVQRGAWPRRLRPCGCEASGEQAGGQSGQATRLAKSTRTTQLGHCSHCESSFILAFLEIGTPVATLISPPLNRRNSELALEGASERRCGSEARSLSDEPHRVVIESAAAWHSHCAGSGADHSAWRCSRGAWFRCQGPGATPAHCSTCVGRRSIRGRTFRFR